MSTPPKSKPSKPSPSSKSTPTSTSASTTYLTTAEVAAHLGVHEKQVYRLLKRGALPGTRLTGKWLFPKDLVDAAVSAAARAHVDVDDVAAAAAGSVSAARAVVVAGECDDVWDAIAQAWNTAGGVPLARAPATMEQGLVMLARSVVDAVLVEHAPPDEPCKSSLDDIVRRSLGSARALVRMPLVRRSYGLCGKKRHKLAHVIDDPTLRIAVRESGSAARTLLTHLLLRDGHAPAVVDKALRRQVVVPDPHAALSAVLADDVDAAFVDVDAAAAVSLRGDAWGTLELSLLAPREVLLGPLAALPALLTAPSWRGRLEKGAGSALIVGG